MKTSDIFKVDGPPEDIYDLDRRVFQYIYEYFVEMRNSPLIKVVANHFNMTLLDTVGRLKKIESAGLIILNDVFVGDEFMYKMIVITDKGMLYGKKK